jgi:ketosteroid isomerase-like protein
LKGSYLMVFRHEPDGKWRIVQQVWTEAPPENAGHS